MTYVELYRLQNNGDQEVIVTCMLQENGVVLCNGNEAILNNLQTEGIKDFSNSKPSRLFPKDGKVFLEQLQYNFSSGYLNASHIKE